MTKINIKRISELCEEISELEARMSAEAQEEIKPTIQAFLKMVREYAPFVGLVKWTTYSTETEFILTELINEEQQALLDEMKSIISNLSIVSKIAFGYNAKLTLDIFSGELMRE